jgi:hypothetical protein
VAFRGVDLSVRDLLRYMVSESDGSACDVLLRTTGGPEEWISRDVDPIFKGQARYGLLPVDWAASSAIRLTVWSNFLYVGYDTPTGPIVERYPLLR